LRSLGNEGKEPDDERMAHRAPAAVPDNGSGFVYGQNVKTAVTACLPGEHHV
jgi:hypothetical protein